MRAYYVSATIRPLNRPTLPPWRLWMEKIQAHSLVDARAAALELIKRDNREYGQIDIIWDEFPAKSADDILGTLATKAM